jgi:methyltransferase (TIGR00027 family)
MAVSRTAQYVALYRALESLEPAPLFRDEFARRFLPRGLDVAVWIARNRWARRALLRYADRRAPGARTSAIARTALLDDVVRRAVADGVTQLVLLGAGFDSRAQRMPELAGVRVFEVDREDTQRHKRARLADAAQTPTYVAVDFLRDQVGERLAAASWRAAAPTLVLWEGVTNYLTEPAVERVLRWVGAMPPGSAIAFTYVHRGLLDGSVPFEGGAQIRGNVERMGEPWTFGLAPEEVAAFVARAGLTLREDHGADEYRRRYLGDGPYPGYAFYRLAIAGVTARSAGASRIAELRDAPARPGRSA